MSGEVFRELARNEEGRPVQVGKSFTGWPDIHDNTMRAMCYRCGKTAMFQVAVLFHDSTGAESLNYFCEAHIAPDIRERFQII